jgi:CDP-4-dehydro-6-deoxyglucose reductase/3-phenylpropionate/trans-cinnamate dioxygenase ferredoxin reductase subunit
LENYFGPKVERLPQEFVLDAAERAGYAMPSSCRKGVCNTCEAAPVEGEVDQRGPAGGGPPTMARR